MLQILKAEWGYNKYLLTAYYSVVITFAFFTPYLPGLSDSQEWRVASEHIARIPIYLSFSFGFAIFGNALTEKRERYYARLPMSLRGIALGRILILIPFQLGLAILSISTWKVDTSNLFEEVGQQILFLNFLLIVMVARDLNFLAAKKFRIGYYFVSLLYLSILVATYESVSLEMFFWLVLFLPLPGLLYSSVVSFARRKSYLR